MDPDDELVLENEAEEIERLQLPEEVNKPIDPEEEDERVARIEFNCSGCEMQEMVHYFGRKPPFALGVIYPEDNYVMRDPFQPPPPRWQSKPEYISQWGLSAPSAPRRCARILAAVSTTQPLFACLVARKN
ncbi:GD18563 [Drosophila simulans]|uniref:Cysteine-rich DPF motif domain-containing protein 1 n=1 Tax=Drosophila simulans TaxID=7240 RepID=B4QXZ5_DROSI|nr:GD18563 [Drosophila simulans]